MSYEKSELQKAVQYRIKQGKLSILALGTGLSEEILNKFATTGEISDTDFIILKMMA